MKSQPHTTVNHDHQAGFTIIELLIATTVFSMVLLVILYGVLSFTHAYYSGVNSSTVQDTARGVLNTVTQSIEFSGNVITPTSAVGGGSSAYYFCTGGSTYYYIPGVKYDGSVALSGTNPGLYTEPGGCTSSPNFADAKGRELLESGMRVTYLHVDQTTSPRLYNVQFGLTYGDSDLLCSHSMNGSKGGCLRTDALNASNATVQGTGPNDVVCKQVTGSQFCAHAGLSTIVSLRVASSELAP